MNRKTMNIYLDVDGTLLTKHGEPRATSLRGKPAPHVVEFLEKVTSDHDTYWLTTHCRHGDDGPVRAILAQRLPKAALPFLEKIKPTAWDVSNRSNRLLCRLPGAVPKPAFETKFSDFVWNDGK